MSTGTPHYKMRTLTIPAMSPAMQLPDFPPRFDARRDIYKPLPSTGHLVDWETVDATDVSSQLLDQLAATLSQEGSNNKALESLFRRDGSFWRDTLALTAHIRTFSGPVTIATMLRRLGDARGISGFTLTKNASWVVSASPETVRLTLDGIKRRASRLTNMPQSWVDCSFTFRASQPKARCQGKMMLVPETDLDGTAKWKIWSLATYLAEFEELPEDAGLLTTSSPAIPAGDKLETDVLIVGAGNAGLIQAARLKALGIDHMLVEKNARAGDNWSKRYDYLRFHIGKNYCQVPYLPYAKSANYILTRDELRDQMRRFADEFDLDKRVMYDSVIQSTAYDEAAQVWHVEVLTGGLVRSVRCKAMVLATGAGYNMPRIPAIEDVGRFRGPEMHSNRFRNGASLKSQGVESVIVVGSAASAFDVLEDCHQAGLRVTMVQRSPILVIPMEYYEDPKGLGVFDHVSTTAADAMFMTGALHIGGELSRQGHAARARAEP